MGSCFSRGYGPKVWLSIGHPSGLLKVIFESGSKVIIGSLKSETRGNNMLFLVLSNIHRLEKMLLCTKWSFVKMEGN